MARTLIGMGTVLVVNKLIALAAIMMQTVPATDLEVEENEQPVFPKAFRGYWASTLKDCTDETALTGVRITRNRIYGYESNSVLLVITPVNHHSTPARREALTVTALTAERGEDEVGTGKVRLSRVGPKLHMSRADVVSEDEHFQQSFSNVKCPETTPR
jgi:hypothetical protein